MSTQSPVLFCTFNRPDLAARVLRRIAESRPAKLFVIGDGPRANRPGEVQLVTQMRQLVEQIDWECEVTTHFADNHLGCRVRMLSGIRWAFEHCDRLIILEDDCLPCADFFQFCDQLLGRFCDDPRIMMVSGNNFQPGPRSAHSYYFSKWPHIWGWATWKRAWDLCDDELAAWPSAKRSGLCRRVADSPEEASYWTDLFDRQYRGEIDTWDNAWALSCWLHDGLAVLPQVNLVSNLGFRDDATHTTDSSSELAGLPVADLKTLDHPPVVIRDIEADRHTWNKIFNAGDACARRRRPKRTGFFRRRRAA